jgi:hypothetical protein
MAGTAGTAGAAATPEANTGNSSRSGGVGSSRGGSSEGGSGQGGFLAHIRCQVESDPPLPPPIAAALALQLEAGRADLFLDSLCLGAHSAVVAAKQLSPQALRAAGLLPSAVRLLGGVAGGAGKEESGTDGGPSSALRLKAHLQQGERAATLCLSFHAAGYTLLQLQSAPTQAAVAAGNTWIPEMWLTLFRHVPSFAPVEGGATGAGGDSNASKQAATAAPAAAAATQDSLQKRQVREAWLHRDGLAAALALILRSVGNADSPTGSNVASA